MSVRDFVKRHYGEFGPLSILARIIKGSVEAVASCASTIWFPLGIYIVTWLAPEGMTISLLGSSISTVSANPLPTALIVLLLATYRDYNDSTRCQYGTN